MGDQDHLQREVRPRPGHEVLTRPVPHHAASAPALGGVQALRDGIRQPRRSAAAISRKGKSRMLLINLMSGSAMKPQAEQFQDDGKDHQGEVHDDESNDHVHGVLRFRPRMPSQPDGPHTAAWEMP